MARLKYKLSGKIVTCACGSKDFSGNKEGRTYFLVCRQCHQDQRINEPLEQA